MAKNEPKKKTKIRSAGDLTTVEIKKITDELVALREKLRLNGATALTPTPAWSALRKEIALLNKSLNADAAAKLDALDTDDGDTIGPQSPVGSNQPPTDDRE
jgi:hypothetical protein